MVENDLIEKRKKAFIDFIKKKNAWVILGLIVIVILGVYMRSIPMHTRPEIERPGLWDVARDSWTLGPDLDPWFFTRWAETIEEEGKIPEIDNMRYVPLGFDTSRETKLWPYMIYYTYEFSSLFYDGATVVFAAAFIPVIMFALTILAFFFFVREIFIEKNDKTKANIIALISTAIMVVVPVFLSRTIAGIPEKESPGFFLMFLSFYLFLKAWRCDKTRNAVFLGVLSGLSTAAMGLIWGGVIYIYSTIGIAVFLGFLLNKVGKKEFATYLSWIISAVFILLAFTNRFTLYGLIASTSSGLAFFVLFILAIHFLLWNTKLKEYKPFKKVKIPRNVVSLILGIIFIIILTSIFLGPDFILNIIKDINQTLFDPVTGRWNTTVAENRQPYFTEWARNFGPFIGSVPIMFWLFFIGSVVLFKEMMNKLKNKDAWILTIIYVIFFFGIVFSRYSSSSIFNGDNFVSKSFYYLSILFLIGGLIYHYSKYHKEKNESFEKINFEYLFLFSLFALALVSARSAVRLIMVLGPIAPIFVGYLIVNLFYKFRETKDETLRAVYGIGFIILIILGGYVFINYYTTVSATANAYIPGPYNQQWQKAMYWVDTNLSEDAVFGHWWDYGYWVQSMGNRATVLDGGNAIVYWNYLMGRHVLTGDDQEDALDFLYAHETSHFLIDSTDIGKYGAFSSIGSNGKGEDCDNPSNECDRYSWIPIMVSDQNQMQETAEGIIRIYQGGAALDDDIVYNDNGTEIFLPRFNAGVGGVILEIKNINGSVSINQPEAGFIWNNQQYRIPLRYVEFNGQFYDFGNGLEGAIKIIPALVNTGQGMNIDQMGAGIYISPRVMRGFLAQKYLLDDPFENFPAFELEYTESNYNVENVRMQGQNIGEFLYFNGLQGPIKIWGINYTGNETIRQEFIDTDPSKYISWKL